jgi:hypothetical protein
MAVGERAGIPSYDAIDAAKFVLSDMENRVVARGIANRSKFLSGPHYYDVQIVLDPYERQRPIVQQELHDLQRMQKAGATAGWMRFHLNETLTRMPQPSIMDII